MIQTEGSKPKQFGDVILYGFGRPKGRSRPRQLGGTGIRPSHGGLEGQGGHHARAGLWIAAVDAMSRLDTIPGPLGRDVELNFLGHAAGTA